MRSVLAKIAGSLEGTVSLSVESLTDQFSVLTEDHVRVDPEVWERAGRAINQQEGLRLQYQRFDGVTGQYAVEPYHLETYVRERVWHPSQELRERRDGRLEVRLETSGRKELTRWILSWMPHVRVLAPRELRERIRSRARRVGGRTQGAKAVRS